MCEHKGEKYYTGIENKAAKFQGSMIYQQYHVCCECEQLLLRFTDERDVWYEADEESKKAIFKRIGYKAWRKVENVTTEYGIFKLKGTSGMYRPIKGKVYALIEEMIVNEEWFELKKIEQVYPKEVKLVREFTL